MVDLLFVYGTLRPGSGHAMAQRLAAAATHLGLARCRGTLHDFGTHPGLLAGVEWVVGDLYRLDDAATLAWLDAYEEVDAPPQAEWFVRERATVEAASGAVTAWVYRYHGRPRPGSHVPSGDYLRRGGPAGATGLEHKPLG